MPESALCGLAFFIVLYILDTTFLARANERFGHYKRKSGKIGGGPGFFPTRLRCLAGRCPACVMLLSVERDGWPARRKSSSAYFFRSMSLYIISRGEYTLMGKGQRTIDPCPAGALATHYKDFFYCP